MRLGRPAAVLAVTTALVAGTTLAASAITGGQLDGDRHPNVGLIVFYDSDGRFRCSATLVRDDLLITAAHCTDGVVGKVLVDFDSTIAEQPNPDGSSPIPAAANPAGGYTQQELESKGYLSGTAHTHPEYSNFTDLRNWNDVGVVQLDHAVSGITPAKIAPENYLDQFTSNILNKTLFETVGYGTEVRQAESGPQKPTPMSYPIVRRYALEPGQKLTPQILQTNGNENDPRGTGGTCFGDSGGPSFNGGYQVTVTSYGYTNNCRYLDGLQRIDIPSVQDWLKSEFNLSPAG